MLDKRFNPQFNITYACNMYNLCQYCYAKEFARKALKKDMDIADFDRVLAWVKHLGVKDIVFIGGEPTLHPNLINFLEVLSKHAIFCRVFTNGLSNSDVMKQLCWSDSVYEIFFHYNETYLLSNTLNRDKFFQNISDCYKHNKNIYLRYNISNKKFDYETVVMIAKRYGATIGYSLSAPSFGNTPYILLEEIKEYVPRLKKFFLLTKKERIRLLLARPLPLCAFDEAELPFLEDIADVQGTCEPINDVTINPDLTVQLCSVVGSEESESPIKSKDDLIYILRKLKQKGAKLKEIPSTENCAQCKFFPHRCQGGCLSYKPQSWINSAYMYPRSRT